ncbi:hypothetical protein PN419_09005 [Halorubrum ezzemoulense]|uniref:hypothetical protein n=1 Tax=Halorubrum ezzemoulense TaxID=337243 RepID=UPI00232D89B5|nr:hypothetical protein [Halorubrum ezzemoulense]MDB9249146.1 hypothetical protein [Halorubrum ezzemoulense]MDB9259698.1 hypothetical protein [Halorubrum ezzemoulense]MDB9263163.1 hypothetical protein [Halorubrum ezzemoulense]MDB9266407.1 hypothetical protein [Halorubrum ezzemoulense]MDB9270059.1 hypothetical protein [Halorubrum ezzemoulense]
MTSYISKASTILQEEGLLVLLKRAIRLLHNSYIAPFLPRKEVEYNGVVVPQEYKFKHINPRVDLEGDMPHYESGLVSGIEEFVQKGDKVVIIGGGWGVTAVKAAQQVGKSGEVVVYEGSTTEVNKVRETAKRNDVSDRVSVIHGVVGSPIKLRGESGSVTHFSPEELPECDVLELDCEGAEIEILKKIIINPRVILVESHGLFQAPSSEVKELLEGLSYTIKSKEIADLGMKEEHKSDDVYVFSAVLDSY